MQIRQQLVSTALTLFFGLNLYCARKLAFSNQLVADKENIQVLYNNKLAQAFHKLLVSNAVQK